MLRRNVAGLLLLGFFLGAAAGGAIVATVIGRPVPTAPARLAAVSVGTLDPDCASEWKELRDGMLRNPTYKNSGLTKTFIAVGDCIDEKARQMSPGPDTADTIAAAVASECQTTILEEAIAKEKYFGKEKSPALREYKKGIRDWEDQARQIVLKLRGAHCPA